MTSRLHFLPTPSRALALVTSPRLGLRQLYSLLNGIASLDSQNKVSKIPNCLVVLFTIISVLPELAMNLVIYPTKSWGSLIIGSNTLLGAPSDYDLGG